MDKHESKMIQHLGIIAGVCKEIQLAELIDSQVNNGDRKVSVGEAVVAMGITGRPLYLTPRFYESRPVDRLIREDLSRKDFHDYSLGTALDIIYETGITELFFSVALKVLKAQGIDTRFAHLDSTIFSVYVEYNSEAEEVPDNVIHITKGFSKDHAPELNQVVAQPFTRQAPSLSAVRSFAGFPGYRKPSKKSKNCIKPSIVATNGINRNMLSDSQTP